MDHPPPAPYRVGDWRVDPRAGTLERGTVVARVDDRALRVLARLARRAGEVASVDELLQAAWPDVVVSQDSVYQAIATLRRTMGDPAREPVYIATVPRQGYRLVAPVENEAAEREVPAPSDAAPPADLPAPAVSLKHRPRRGIGLPAAIVTVVAVLAASLWGWQAVSTATLPVHAIAVLPFADLTDDMTKEPFADGMTEQLIATLGALPGMRVPSRTASFALKDSHKTVPEVARLLHVDYLMEGSVRQAGPTVRVTARLVRASDGYLLCTRTYDRTVTDILKTQDEIAREVSRSIGSCWSAEAVHSR